MLGFEFLIICAIDKSMAQSIQLLKSEYFTWLDMLLYWFIWFFL